MHRLRVCFLPLSRLRPEPVCEWCWIKEEFTADRSQHTHRSRCRRASVVELLAPERNISPQVPVALMPSAVREFMSKLSCECGAKPNNVSVCDISWPKFEYEPNPSVMLRVKGAPFSRSRHECDDRKKKKKKGFKATIWQPDVNLHPALICPTTFTNHKLLNRSLPGR